MTTILEISAEHEPPSPAKFETYDTELEGFLRKRNRAEFHARERLQEIKKELFSSLILTDRKHAGLRRCSDKMSLDR